MIQQILGKQLCQYCQQQLQRQQQNALEAKQKLEKFRRGKPEIKYEEESFRGLYDSNSNETMDHCTCTSTINNEDSNSTNEDMFGQEAMDAMEPLPSEPLR